MPRVLSEADVVEFRERLCDAAERLFADKGPEAVTMRQLAAELGVSPMTPYRYFKDKDDILAAVRTIGFDRFAETLEAAYAKPASARAKGAAVGEAYVTFAFEHPQTYKLIFDLNQPNADQYPDLIRASQRAHGSMSRYVRALVEDGVLKGDPEEIGMMFWAASHGAVSLVLAGKLPADRARALISGMISAMSQGLRA